MQKPEQYQNPLATQGIGQLLVKYAVPSVISMLVMSLYNIADQIFIGWGVGYIGNTATTVSYPLTTIGIALALLLGNGSAAFISLELGKGNTGEAQKTLGNAITLLLGSSLTFVAIVFAFLRPILVLLGATDAVMPYAVDYTSIIMLGMPFAMFSTALSNPIRADGSPIFSMVATLAGAILNIGLDAIFVLVWDMGVKGAATATVISQIVSCLMVLAYIGRFAKYIRFSPKNMRLDRNLVKRITTLGSSSFITQGALTILNIVLNNVLRKYGALSVYGSEVPLAAMGIIMKVNGILISVILGVSIGAQPIYGFNFGAGNYARVRQTYKTVIRTTLSVAVLCNLIFVLVPGAFIRLFGDNSPLFFDFATMAMRTFLCCVFLAGFQIPSSNFFQSTGRPLKAMTLSMTRQLLFLVPLLLLLPRFFGLSGILYAGPIGDVCAAVVTGVFIIKEMKVLRQLEEKHQP